jgi:hypothetical protein
MAASKKTIVYILSSSYSGSHYLSLLLGSHSQTKHLGEVRKLKSSKPSEQGRELTMNKGDILEGINAANIREVYDIIFSRIDPKVNVVIDASKKVESWAAHWLDLNQYERKYIHLIRDPRAMVRRWKIRTNANKNLRLKGKLCKFNPKWIPKLLLAGEDDILLYRWMMENQVISRFIKDNNLDGQLVTYHDVAVHTEETLKRLMPWLGLQYEPSQLEYWKVDHIGTQKKAYTSVKSRQDCQIDLRWQSDLAQPIQSKILKNRDSQNYIKELGLRVVDNGLTKM